MLLKPVDKKNIEYLRSIRNDRSVRKYFREYRDITEDMQLSWYNTRGNNSDPRHICWEVWPSASASIVGFCSLQNIDFRLRSAEFSVFINPKEQGKHYGSDAVKSMLDYGFRDLGLKKVWGEVFSNNDGAMRVYKKIGFSIDGIMRCAKFYDGKYINSYIISIIDDEFWALQGATKGDGITK